jgi:Na+:H+ antiporter, NhaA family
MSDLAPQTLDHRPVLRLLQPFARFAQLETSSSLVLLAATIAALLFANTAVNPVYQHILSIPFGFTAGDISFSWPLSTWVNDVLMAIFFLVVGLEVKRELLVGELATFRRAILPVLAAAGGMIAPALLYLVFNHGTPAQRGWGVPIATDIAFSLAILTALGRRVPFALRIFLASLAIADDIGGVLVIAVAYTKTLHLGWLLASAGVLLLGMAFNWLGVVRLSAYFALGAVLWCTLHASGIHPTLAGIGLALVMPSRTFIHPERFVDRAHRRLEQFKAAHMAGPAQEASAEHLDRLRHGLHLVESPLDRMQRQLHPWVSYGIMPFFALVNAGISFHGFRPAFALQPTFAGVALGLLLGKPIGITLFSWLAVRLRIAQLPHGVTWRHLHGASWVAGIGFTVAIFIAGLAFGEGESYTQTRIAILLASSSAALIGALLLRFTCKLATEQETQEAEAEAVSVS